MLVLVGSLERMIACGMTTHAARVCEHSSDFGKDCT
jgi:hypothetical protein